MNELVWMVNIELHTYWKLYQELEKLVHDDLDEMFQKILEAPKKKDMDSIMTESKQMRDEITWLTNSIIENWKILVNLEKWFEAPMDPA